VAPRVLILTASVGEGHDLPARTLGDQILEERPDAEVVTEDALLSMGRVVRWMSEDSATIVFYRFQFLWDAAFWIFARNRFTRRGTQRLLTRMGGPGILRLVDRVQPDVIASVYPNVTEVLGRLRRSGRLSIPVVAGITDLAAMHYWATPGADVHLVTHPESDAEVRAVAGRHAVVHCVHGFTKPEFLVPRAQADARAALGLPQEGGVVLVSGGGWGVGDVEGALEEALAVEEVAQVVCLCGRNDRLRERIATRFAADRRVRVEGFTEVMAEWMAAADVLVHSTGGLTVLESIMRGSRPISYGWGRGHLRLNNEGYRRFDLADVVASRSELGPAIRTALGRERMGLNGFAELPSAASFVLAAAEPARELTSRGAARP
jgi:UDP-N-acetylglucosamine:LPS N-acetylglucosamine transferase